jgi:hypothetical protein
MICDFSFPVGGPSMKRKWLKVLMLLMMAGASFGSPMNPKEIEELMHIMNQTRIEFTLPDEDDKGDGGKTGAQQAAMNHLLELRNERR